MNSLRIGWSSSDYTKTSQEWQFDANAHNGRPMNAATVEKIVSHLENLNFLLYVEMVEELKQFVIKIFSLLNGKISRSGIMFHIFQYGPRELF